ncbi:hypothetical protein UFOVP653_27 [uncultured Caudovirales phage]|uniref:Uncharacterized protein n=1 Tax=uncultured Caudovirales phage TaxID=2100421 RepID=A0A6J5N7M7_9CAUD|nr:hypothetical protein UFOVP653_27 [uncultured Caudovirales phage]
MTDEWWAKIYEKAGRDMMEKRAERLLHEFRYLGAQNGNRKKQLDGVVANCAGVATSVTGGVVNFVDD